MSEAGSRKREPQCASTIFMSRSMLGKRPLLTRIKKSLTCTKTGAFIGRPIQVHMCAVNSCSMMLTQHAMRSMQAQFGVCINKYMKPR